MAAYEFTTSEMPEGIQDCVRNSVKSTFNIMFGSEPVFLDDVVDKKVGDGVVGIISFVGDITWLLMLALPKSSSQKVVSKFCGFDIDYDSPDMGDVVGELANVLAGDIVARLATDGVKVAMSLPTIMRGHDVEPLVPRGLPSQKMYFSLPEGEMVLKVAASKPGEPMGRRPGG